MIKQLSIFFLVISSFLQAQDDWSANGYDYYIKKGEDVDSSYTSTYIQDSITSNGKYAQYFSSGGAPFFFTPDYSLFIAGAFKRIPETKVPDSFSFDFYVKSIDSVETLYLGFGFGHQFWSIDFRIRDNFEVGKWKSIKCEIADGPQGDVFSKIFFELGFESFANMHFEYIIDNLRMHYSDTTVILDDFGDILTKVETEPESTEEKSYLLGQNYPNPFNPITKIQFSIPQSSDVSLKIYDMMGREIKTLLNENKPPGNYEIEFDGSGLSSGIYFYRITTGTYSDTKKMILMK